MNNLKNRALKMASSVVLVAAGMVLLAVVAGRAQTTHPYASAKSLEEPVLFGEGSISTAEDELNAAFTPDGRSLYFSKNTPGSRQGVIVTSHFVKGRWGRPEVAPFSGQYSDYDPFFSSDGAKLFFISNRPTSGTTRKKDFDIWMVEKVQGGWGAPKNLGTPINTDRNEYYPSVARDGTLYFSTDRQGGKGGFDLYRSRYADGKYAEPENLGDANTQFSEIDSHIAPDQSFIVFASYGRPDSLGSGDLYISFNRGGTWTKAVHLDAPINTSAREYCPIGSPDGKYFFFTSERGFADDPPARPLTYGELEARLRSVLNGRGNIYQIEMRVLKSKESEVT